MSGRSYDTLAEAVADPDGMVRFPDGGCGCWLGRCSRDKLGAGECDKYEPHELTLEQDGLPWFYFIASADHLASEFREEFLKESKALWGDKSDA